MSFGALAQNKAVADSVRSEYVAASPSWVDAQHLRGVVAIQTESAPRAQLLEQLFWNPSIAREPVPGAAEPTDAFAAPRVRVAPDGALRTAKGTLRSPILFQGYGVSAAFGGAVLVAHAKAFELWKPTATLRVRVLATGRYWDGWLARHGRITVWPDASGYTRGTLSFTLSLPRTAKPLSLRIAGRRLRMLPGERLPVRRWLHGRGPQTLSFSASGGSVTLDLRPVSVRSTMPVFRRATSSDGAA